MRMMMLTLGLLALSVDVASAQPQSPYNQADNQPVALVAQVSGEATLQHNPDKPGRKLFWLDLLYPQDRLATGAGGKVITLFFQDGRLEAVGPKTAAQVSFRGLVSGTRASKLSFRHGGTAEVEVPTILEQQVQPSASKPSNDAFEQEKIYLEGWVNNIAYPPVFHCKDLKLPAYRFQIFDDRGQFLYEKTTANTRFKFPYKAPFHLTKNGLYQWQAVGPDGTVLVVRYPFSVLTRLQSRDVNQAEARFNKKGKAANQVDYTNLFLAYQSVAIPDKTLHVLLKMSKMDPGNPSIANALAQEYLLRGCPAHAAEVLKTTTP